MIHRILIYFWVTDNYYSLKMQELDRGDDANISIAERLASTVGSDSRNADREVSMEENYIEYDSVRISPSFMEFKDAYEGMTFRQTFIVQNMGENRVHVRICSPNSIAFRMETLQGGVFLSPGLRILRQVHYSYKRTSVLHTMIPIYINWKYIDYHIICNLAKAVLSIEPTSLDFGLVDIGSTSGIKSLILRNDGGKSVGFVVDLGPNEMDLTVRPMRATMPPRSKVLIRVELIGIEEGSFFGEFWIKSTPNIRVPVKVNIIIPRLIVYHPNATGDFTLIDFPPTFTNTVRHDTIILRSFSTQPSNFVVLGEIDNELIPMNKIDPRKHPAFQFFSIYPLEGRMDPFEGRIFNITFSPTVKVIKETEELRKRDRQDFMVFVRISRVHFTEMKDILRNEMDMDDRTEEPQEKVELLEPGSEESSTILDNEPPEPPGYETVRLCLYGEAEEACLKFVPNELHLGDITVAEVVRRELTICNPSNSASVTYQFVPNATAHCEPSNGRIASQNSIQVLITVTGNYDVKVPFKLVFDVLVQTCNLTNLKTSYMKSKSCWVLVWSQLTIPSIRDKRKKVSCGMTRVGGAMDDGCFSTPDPANTELMNDSKNMSLPTEAALRSQNRLYWSDYIRSRRTKREVTALKRLTLTLDDTTDCKDLLTAKLPAIKEQSIALQMLGKAVALKVVNKAKDEMLVPLSPLQIYNVKICPTVLAYGLVLPGSVNYRALHVENLNEFSVMLRLVSWVSKAISFPNDSLTILHSGAQVTKLVEYRAQKIGKLKTYINYIINDNHSFAMTITANTVIKSLSLNVRELAVGNDYLPQEAYQPLSSFVEIKNQLDATTRFTWDLRKNASFTIYPMSGEVRGNRTLLAEVCCDPIPTTSNNTEAILMSESGTCVNLKLETKLRTPEVAFVNDTLSLGEIPLNTTNTAVAVLHNAEFREVKFQIDPSSLIYGCEVYPHQGVISPRGIVTLEVRLKFDACFKFSITIEVMVQKCLKLELKLLGQVSFPLLKLAPETISIKRISPDAISTHSLTASNVGTTVIKVQILLEEYPEYSASFSPHRKDPAIDSESFTISPGASVSFYLHFMPMDLASYYFYLPIVINEILGPVTSETPKRMEPADFLKPRETHYVHYRGIEMTKLPPSMSKVSVDCTVSGRVISFSKHVFHFDVMLNKTKDKLRVFNETNREVAFIIRIDDFSDPKSPFSITWFSGVKPAVTPLSIVCTLQPREEVLFLIEFKPMEKGIFDIEAPIFVRGELEGNMFNILLLNGINTDNCIVCDRRDLFFPPVPLAVEVEQKLTLKVSRCQNPLNIQAVVDKPVKFSGTYTNDCIQVKFLSSNIVSGRNSDEELEISVLFRSEFPVAFSTRIEFCVRDSVACSVNVCVIADNCILTTYGCLWDTNKFYSVAKPQEQISFPSITSRGDGSSSLTKPELIIPRKPGELQIPRLSIDPSNSTTSRKSMKTTLARLRPNEHEDDVSECNEDKDSEVLSLHSKLSGTLAQTSDQDSKVSKTFYPYFPITIEASDSNSYMHRALNATEQWMYSGGFKFNFYPNIVDGITGVLSGICSSTSRPNDKRKAHTITESFIDLLASLAGQDVLKYIGDNSHVPQDPVERVCHVLKLYDNALEFLTAQGSFLPHVQSQFLLSYNDYLLNCTKDKSSTDNLSAWSSDNSIGHEKMTKELFQSRSKQCWLDVALQTFKTLILGRISLKTLQDDTNSLPSQRDLSATSLASSAVSILEHVAKKTSYAENATDKAQQRRQSSDQETLLLSWLQYHFDQQRLEGWMKDDRVYLNPRESRDILESRTVSNFEWDLADSLVLIAVTAAHCPYLIQDHFTKIFISPRNVEEVHHNAVCLATAWRRIRLGFMITPAQVTKPNCVQMVMLVAHLFHILPSFVPSTKIEFCCPLTETVTRQISFSNKTEFPVTYVVEFIGNDMNLFTTLTPQPVVNLQARGAGSLKIQFHARKIAETKAYVILCGSSVAPHFAKNHVFVLEGCTSHLGVTNVYEIEGMLYKVCEETLSIPVPFKETVEYDILLTEEQPTVPASLKLSRWADLKTRKVPRRLFLNQTTICVKENSYQADLSITTACIVPTKRCFWIVFESEIGDFIIQINSASKIPTTDYITVEWEREGCTCGDLPNGISSTCPLNLEVAIPVRNVQLWSCVNEMFQKTLDPKESVFWSRHFDTNIGLRLIHWLMGDYQDLAAKEFMHIFNTSVTYNITTTNRDVVVPAKFSIGDVRPREKEIQMSVHIPQTTPQVYAETIKLSSLDDMEYRVYKIDFLCKTPISPTRSFETEDPMKKKNKRRSTTLSTR